MPRAKRPCSTPGCPTLVDQGRCDDHRRQADQARGTRQERGYGPAHQHFRATVLRRDPVCVLCQAAISTVADHYPTSRRDLVAQGFNPNDPQCGRGLCKQCHDRETAQNQPGGWHTGVTRAT